MTIKLGDSRITPVNQREGYSDTINPSSFVNAWSGTIQAGQQLQQFGAKGFDMAVAEQKVYNSTQVDMLDIERKTKMNTFLNNTRNGGNPQYLEQDYNTAYKQINKDIIKKVIIFMIKKRCSTDNITAVIGPCISYKSYEVKQTGEQCCANCGFLRVCQAQKELT